MIHTTRRQVLTQAQGPRLKHNVFKALQKANRSRANLTLGMMFQRIGGMTEKGLFLMLVS